MNNKALLIVIIICSAILFYAQDKGNRIEFGFAYGLGNEFKNRNVKIQTSISSYNYITK